MAALNYPEGLIPSELKVPIADFLESGLQQLSRVLQGPQARTVIAPSEGYKQRQRRTRKLPLIVELPTSRQAHNTPTAGPSTKSIAECSRLQRPLEERALKRDSASGLTTAAFVLAALPASPLKCSTSTPIAQQLQILSDTVRHVCAGTAARTMSQILIHPIDTVKTRLQINKLTAPIQLQVWRKSSKAHPVTIRFGHKQLSLRNWLVQGPVDLYRGLTGAILGTIPVAMVYFTTYELSKSFLEARGASGSTAHLASASAGAMLSAFIRVPTDTLKHRAQAYIVPNIFQGAKSIVGSEGIRGLYHGMLPTLLRDVPELALQFTLYESLRQCWERNTQVKKLHTWEHLVLGGVSGAIAASATMPLDVAKTALQCGNYGNISVAMREVVRDKGLHGLFAGMGPRVVQIAIQGAIFFTLFEAWKAQLKPSPLRFEGDRLMAPKLWRKRRDHVWKRQFVIQ